jgi:hypothetical protein
MNTAPLNNVQPTKLLTWTDSLWFIGFEILTAVVMKIELFIIHGVFWSLNVAPTKIASHTPAHVLLAHHHCRRVKMENYSETMIKQVCLILMTSL